MLVESKDNAAAFVVEFLVHIVLLIRFNVDDFGEDLFLWIRISVHWR